MIFEILFHDPDSDGRRLVKVKLPAEEVKAAAAHPCPDLVAQCYALTHGYAMVPAGWHHYRDRIEQIALLQ